MWGVKWGMVAGNEGLGIVIKMEKEGGITHKK